MNAKGVQNNMFSRTSIVKLLNKIDCSNVLKDGKIEAVHDLLEQQQALYLLALCICRLHQGLTESLTSVRHQWMVTSYLECILRKNRSNRSLNGTVMFMKSIFFITFGLSQEARKVQLSHF